MDSRDVDAFVRRHKDEINIKKAVPGTPLGDLYLTALKGYRNRCFWGLSPEPTLEGLLVIAERLRTLGDLDAWMISEAIRGELEGSPISFKRPTFERPNFFDTIHDEHGFRDHLIDLSVNMFLSASSRSHARDVASIWLIDNKVMPLWHGLWATSAKDDGWNPSSLSRSLLMFASYADDSVRELPFEPRLHFSQVISDLEKKIERADEIFFTFRGIVPGCLFVDGFGDLVNDPEAVVKGLQDGTVVEERPSYECAQSVHADPDHDLLERLIAEHGNDQEMQMAM
jgi:hypothetical protein